MFFKWLCSSTMWIVFAFAKGFLWIDLLHRVESIWRFLFTLNDEDWNRLAECVFFRLRACFSLFLKQIRRFWMCKKQMTNCKRCECWLCDRRLFVFSACKRLLMRNSLIICSHRVLCWHKSKFVRRFLRAKSNKSRC
jgi:hypothetical protein